MNNDGGAQKRSCTCCPEDNPPVPCPEKFAFRECVDDAERKALERVVVEAGRFLRATIKGAQNWPGDEMASLDDALVALKEFRAQRADEQKRFAGTMAAVDDAILAATPAEIAEEMRALGIDPGAAATAMRARIDVALSRETEPRDNAEATL